MMTTPMTNDDDTVRTARDSLTVRVGSYYGARALLFEFAGSPELTLTHHSFENSALPMTGKGMRMRLCVRFVHHRVAIRPKGRIVN